MFQVQSTSLRAQAVYMKIRNILSRSYKSELASMVSQSRRKLLIRYQVHSNLDTMKYYYCVLVRTSTAFNFVRLLPGNAKNLIGYYKQRSLWYEAVRWNVFTDFKLMPFLGECGSFHAYLSYSNHRLYNTLHRSLNCDM